MQASTQPPRAAQAAPFALAAALALALAACDTVQETSGNAAGAAGRPGQRVDFTRDIRPLLEGRCLECHNSVDAAAHSGLNLETRQLALTTGQRAPAIVPGEPQRSPLYLFLKLGHAEPTAMPPAPDKLWGEQLELIRDWIAQGAPWPAGARLVRPQDW